MERKDPNNNMRFLSGGSEMGELMRNKDWSKTPLSSPEFWPQSLRTTLSIILNSKFPMFLFWGKDLICFYNDAYRPSLGKDGKHPSILGMKGEDAWQEIWVFIKPIIDEVLAGGEASWHEDQLLPIYRNGKIEDVYWTFSYSPVNDESNTTAGVFVTCTEITEKILTLNKMQESEERFRTMAENSEILIAVGDETSHATYFNKAWVTLTGRPAEDLLKFGWADLVHPDDKDAYINIYLSAFEKKISFTGEFRVHNKNREYRWLLANATPRFRADGSFAGYISSCTDITEGKKYQQSQGEQNEYLTNLFKQAPAAIAVVEGSRFVYSLANPLYQQIFNRTEQQLLGKSVWEVFPEVSAQGLYEIFENVYKSGEAFSSYEYAVEWKKDGQKTTVGYFTFVLQPIKSNNGTLLSIMINAFDVTAQVTAKKIIEESEEQFRVLGNNIQNLAWLANSDGYIFWYNQRWYDYTGTTLEEMQGWGWQKVHHPDHAQQVVEFVKKAWYIDKPFELTFPLRQANGEYRWFLTRAVPVKNVEGKIYRWVGTNTDIDDKIKAEKKLKEDDEKLKIVIRASEMGTWELDLITRHVNFSDRYIEILGYTPPVTLTHEQLLARLHPDDLQLRDEAMKHALATGSLNYQYRIIWNDKSLHWIEGKGTVIYDNENRPIRMIGTIQDVTAAKSYQQQLEEREEKFRSLAQSLPQLVWVTDEKGNAEFASSRWEEYSGIKNGGEEEWKAMVHPDDYENINKIWATSLMTGNRYRADVRLKQKMGEYRWHKVVGDPVMGSDGKIIKWVGAFTDVHNEKTFSQELERQVASRTVQLGEANESLAQKNSELEKMNKELQSFAYISSHDLQEPLRKIQIFSNRIVEKEYTNLSHNGKENFNRMNEAAQRMQKLIEYLLEYSRTNNTDGKFETIDLAKIIDEVKQDLSEGIKERNATVEFSELCEIYAIPFQFRQLMNNLIGNALKFSTLNPPPYIKIKSQIGKGIDFKIEKLVAQKNYCHISVSDNGIGFDQQFSERIFEVFQRLHGKSEYKGTGIGLSIVKKIVDNHNGIITATGELNKGATFDIYIPAV